MKNLEEYKISVIVPVYNVRNYLPKCIESIINQTHKNLEIILVDDGSTDDSGKICDEYGLKDDRIVVIHKKNGGLTSGRKAGINIATGNYVGFVDGDDWIDSDMYETLLSYAIENYAQIVLSDMYRHKFTGEQTVWSGAWLSEGCYEVSAQEKLIVSNLISGINSKNKGINGGVHIKLFELNLIKDIVLSIDDRLTGIADDKVIVYPAILNSKRIYVLHKAFYHGVDRKDSATHSVQKNALLVLQLVYDYLKQYFEKSEHKEVLMKQLNSFILQSTISNLNDWAGYTLVPSYFISEPIIMGKNIVLYGAGKVGKSVYSQLVATNFCNIVLWCDKIINEERKIYSSNKIKEVKFDFILVAVLEEAVFESIKKELVFLEIPQEKILWSKIVPINEFFR
ncbi:MAG: glycosyltransferase family 2 protein [Treponemataceae bacterium]